MMRRQYIAIARLALVAVVAALALLPQQATAQPGYIATVAGNGTPTYSGDGGPAILASLSDVHDVVVGPGGSLFIADHSNDRVRKVDPAGTIITVAGNGGRGYSGDGVPATQTSLNQPVSVALDALGNLYIADMGNGRIRKVVPGANGVVDGGTDEIISTAAAGFDTPSGVTVDSSGNLYVAEFTGKVWQVDTVDNKTLVAGGGSGCPCTESCPATQASLLPREVAVDSQGNLFITDRNNCIRKVDGSGTMTTVAGNGTNGYSGDGGPATSATLDTPYDVALDPSGNLYIAEFGNHTVRRVDPGADGVLNGGADEIITTVTGNHIPGYYGDGGPATQAELSSPSGVDVTPAGTIYIADTYNYRIRSVQGPPAVGGIAELPSLAGTSAGGPTAVAEGRGSSAGHYTALAAAMAAGVIAIGAGTWYARRRWLR
jgi:streptogramin lyase